VLTSTNIGAFPVTSPEETNPVTWNVYTAVDPTFVLFGDEPAWDQGGTTAGADGYSISTDVVAMDIDLAEASTITAIDVWLADEEINNDGLLGSFGGTLGWAIYSDATGKPGTLLESGSDAAPTLVDTGRQNVSNADILRVRVNLGGAIELPAGAYWIALHEGEWGSPADGSIVWWVHGPSNLGSSGWQDDNEENPTTWATELVTDSAFALFVDPVYVSGFEGGSTCSWSSGANGSCP